MLEWLRIMILSLFFFRRVLIRNVINIIGIAGQTSSSLLCFLFMNKFLKRMSTGSRITAVKTHRFLWKKAQSPSTVYLNRGLWRPWWMWNYDLRLGLVLVQPHFRGYRGEKWRAIWKSTSNLGLGPWTLYFYILSTLDKAASELIL